MITTEQQTQICVPEKRHAKLKVETQIKEQSSDALMISDATAQNPSAGFSRDMKEQSHPTMLDGMECSAAHAPHERKNGETMLEDDQTEEPDLAEELGLIMDAAPKRSLGIDVAKYQAYLDDEDLSDAQKEQIVLAVFQIMSAFVQLGYGVHPLQEVCGQVEGKVDRSKRADSNDSTTSQKTMNKEFERAAEALPAEAQERRSP